MITRIHLWMFPAVLMTLAISTSVAQPKLPPMQAPPGYTTTVKDVHQTFNFYGLTRTIPLPWERIPHATNQLPSGTKVSPTFKCPSAMGTKLYNDPAGTLPSFGTPARQMQQSFTGKDGVGSILYFEYAQTLPADAKAQLSRLFFGKPEPLDPNTSKKMEQFLVNDHTVIVWCFKNLKSRVKEKHQEMIFALVSEMAQKTQVGK